MDKSYDKRFRRARRKPESGNTHRFTQNKTKKSINDHDEIHGFWFKKFTFIHDRLAQEMNSFLQGAHVPESTTKVKTTSILKDPLKRTAQTITGP